MSYFELLQFSMYMKKKFSKEGLPNAKDGDTPANRWGLFQDYFLEKL